ncbi:MAG: hypothetical protein R3C15_05820 [Thermoleophilia bacterium]
MPGLTTLASVSTVTTPGPASGSSNGSSSARPGSVHVMAQPRASPAPVRSARPRDFSHHQASRFASRVIQLE